MEPGDEPTRRLLHFVDVAQDTGRHTDGEDSPLRIALEIYLISGAIPNRRSVLLSHSP